MKHFKSLSDLHTANGFPPPENPLISLFRRSRTCTVANTEFTTDFYMIGFKNLQSGTFLYGRTPYDHQNGSMSFVKPRQVIEIKNLEFEEDGFLLFIHEDFFNGHTLHTSIDKYGYFDYEVHESLHLSPKEEHIILELFSKIEGEYHNNQDEYSREIMITHIESILKYAQRFYKRQFINRTDLSGTMVSKFNDALSAYSKTNPTKSPTLPSVKAVAEKLNVSPRYLSDLLKQETGKTAIELIHTFLMTEAKNLLKISDINVAETAYHLGFDNLSYFCRLFKREVGLSPNQFKKLG